MKTSCQWALFLVVAVGWTGTAGAVEVNGKATPAARDTAGALAAVQDDAGDDPPSTVGDTEKDELPAKATIAWDVKLFEDATDLAVIKRTVSKDQKQVTWLIEVKTEEAAGKFFFFGTASTFSQYFVRFFDEDNVMIKEVPITNGGGSYEKGQRVRVQLKMPESDILQKSRSAKLVYRKN